MFSIGVDIGGTFTDLTVYDRESGRMFVEKCLSTPKDPERGVLAGLDTLARRIPGLVVNADRFNHATTLVTNAILERKGARTALLTTSGFRDSIEQGSEIRYNVYDLFITFPTPVVPRHLRYGVNERVYANGSVLHPLDEAQVVSIAKELEAQKIEAVAICYLHSYRNADHEKRTAELLREHLPGVPISVSHEVNLEPREYERTSTTALDAYVKPVVDVYLHKLSDALKERGLTRQIEVMLSNGGSTTASTARQFPIQLIESGPAAGVEAAIWMCAQIGRESALSFDMGGTTAKLCIIQEGVATRSRRFEAGRVHRFVPGSGLPVSVPVYELVEIGAGGGSIAQVDDLGLISVGPESAGAEPGPACYGQGGTRPTVTDADLVLGSIDPDFFLGGEMKLDAAAAHRAIAEHVGGPLKLSEHDAAYGVFDLVNETMAAAARLHIAEKGCDPAKLPIIAFGGAGPLHAVELARKLGCPQVIFPPLAGVLSSIGLLTAPPAFERLVTVKRLLSDLSVGDISVMLDGLKREVLRSLEGDADKVRFRFIAEMWHEGQEYPLEVPFVAEAVGPTLLEDLGAKFSARYRDLYGRTDDETPIGISTLRAIGELPQPDTIRPEIFVGDAKKHLGKRNIYDPRLKALIEVDVLNRSALLPGLEAEGPLVVQERESGFVIRKGDKLGVHKSGAIVVNLA
jgi:N-methylhydantoinase A